MPGWVSQLSHNVFGGLANYLISGSLSSSQSTEHMLPQFKKTIKKALKSTLKERQLLRARSAVQRFPVVEWRQLTEDFHIRSIHASRKLAGSDAWRKTDGGDWAPVEQADLTRPAWDQESLASPGLCSTNASQENLAAGQPLLTPPHLSNRDSFALDMSADSSNRNSVASQQQYNTLERANQKFAQQNQHTPDPFMEQGRSSLAYARTVNTPPPRDFPLSSRSQRLRMRSRTHP